MYYHCTHTHTNPTMWLPHQRTRRRLASFWLTVVVVATLNCGTVQTQPNDGGNACTVCPDGTAVSLWYRTNLWPWHHPTLPLYRIVVFWINLHPSFEQLIRSNVRQFTTSARTVGVLCPRKHPVPCAIVAVTITTAPTNVLSTLNWK
jgi:hypothetical protein